MDGIQLATLRGICTAYFQTHVDPALAELREAQLALRQQLQQHSELLASASASASKLHLGGGEEEEHSNGAVAHACLGKPSSMDVEEEEEKNGHSNGRSLCNGEDFRRLEEQAGRLCSTWKEEFRRLEAQLNDLNDRVSSQAHQQSSSTLPCPLDEVKACQDELQQALAGKADQVAVATLAQQQQDIFARLEQKINRKADLGAVATLTQVHEVSTATDRKLKKMSESLDRKANANKVPQLSQVQELKEAVQSKIDASLVPTLAQVEELERLVERLERERLERLEVQSIGQKVEELATKLEHKANGNDISSAIGEVREWISSTVDGKLSADDLLSLDTVERMADRLEEHWCQKGCSRGSRPAMQPAQFFQQPVPMPNNGWSAPKRPNKMASTWDGMPLHQEDGTGTGPMEVVAVWCPIDGGPCQPLQMWTAPSPFGGGDCGGCGVAVDNRHHHQQHNQNHHHHRSHPPHHHHHHHNNHHYNEQHHQQHPTAAWGPVFQVGYNGTHHHPRHWRSRPPRWQQQHQHDRQQQQQEEDQQQLNGQQEEQEEYLQQPLRPKQDEEQEEHDEELSQQEQLEENERQERHTVLTRQENSCEEEEGEVASDRALHNDHGHDACASLDSQDRVSCRLDHDVIHDQER